MQRVLSSLALLAIVLGVTVGCGQAPPLVAPAPTPIPARPIMLIVDNNSSGFSVLDGKWGTCPMSECEGTAYVDDFRYADPGCTTCRARFTFKISQAGEYDVYAWWPRGGDRATDTPFTITYTGGAVSVKVDQRKYGSEWYLLKRLKFQAGETVGVVVAGTDTGYANADAISITAADLGPP